MILGKSASQGIAIAKALILKDHKIQIEEELSENPEIELERFKNSLKTAKKEIREIQRKIEFKLGRDKAEIFEAHLLMLDDPELIDGITHLITHQKKKASKAIHLIAQEFISLFESMDQQYMQERALDVKDITDRLIKIVLGSRPQDLSELTGKTILVAHDITPSQMSTIDTKTVVGVITEIGGKTSHTVIMARSLELPLVVGIQDATHRIKNNDHIILDGNEGIIHLNAKQDLIDEFQGKKLSEDRIKEELRLLVGRGTVTQDGKVIHLEANIGGSSDLDSVLKNDASGIGLFRTEFIYMDRSSPPSENEQYEIYKSVLERMNKKSVVIRTLDVGGDKNVSYLKIPKEENPFLGLRAIRYCLKNQDIFKTQLRALLRASICGNLSIMFPMISNLDELIMAKNILEEVKSDLRKLNIPFSQTLKTGIMIEIPSAAVIADILANHCDFFSIGTNDLIQYMCAVDRMNENVHELYDNYHPGVLRIISSVIRAGKDAGIDVAMCGEMASDEKLIPVLVGMGLNHFSMSSASILKIKKRILSLEKEECHRAVSEILKMASSNDIKEYLSSRT